MGSEWRIRRKGAFRNYQQVFLIIRSFIQTEAFLKRLESLSTVLPTVYTTPAIPCVSKSEEQGNIRDEGSLYRTAVTSAELEHLQISNTQPLGPPTMTVTKMLKLGVWNDRLRSKPARETQVLTFAKSSSFRAISISVSRKPLKKSQLSA